MSEYVKKGLDMLQNPKPKRPQYASHRWTVPDYGKILQMEPDPEYSALLDKKTTKIIHTIVVNMIYYARSVYPTMLRSINEILRVQSMKTRDTKEKGNNITRLCSNVTKCNDPI